MKKFAFSLFLPMLMVSCNNETEDNYLDNNDNTSIEITIPMPDDMRTRGYSDGSRIDNLKCYVYAQSKGTSADPICIEDIVLHQYRDKIGSYWTLQLPKGQTYDLVFFATCGAHDNPAGKLYYDRNTRLVNVNYSSASSNDESFDCFSGSIKDVSLDKGTSYSVTLKRPYAQLNIGTKDIGVYCNLKGMQKSDLGIGVKVKGIYSSFNAMDRSMQGDAKEISFVSTAPPSGQAFPVPANDYLAMDYLLVNDIKADAVMSVDASGTKFDVDFKDVTLKQNCRTNIYGNLLTKTNDYKIEVNENYSGSDSSFIGFDLIFQVEDGTDQISLYYTDPSGNLNEVDLSGYLDSNNTVKVSWDEIGVSDATSIRFVEDPDYWNYVVYDPKLPIVKFLKFDISELNLTSLRGTFAGCKVEELDVIKDWDTSKITDMSRLFYDCQNLKSLDVSHFDTSNVTDMSNMFLYAKRLTTLDVSNFDTSNVTNMRYMFSFCWNITELDLSNFDTTNVTDMSCMFSSISNVKALDLTNFDTSKVTDMSSMFQWAISLQTLDLSNFDTSRVTDMSRMFDDCKLLTTLDLSNFDTSNVTDMQDMFLMMSSLESINVSSFNTSKVTNMNSTFQQCKNLKSLDISNWDTSKVTDMDDFICWCENLTDLYINMDCSSLPNEKVNKILYLCDELRNIHGVFYNLKTDFTLSAEKLAEESVSNIISNLPYVTNKSIYGYTPFKDAQRAVLASKGWNLEYGFGN